MKPKIIPIDTDINAIGAQSDSINLPNPLSLKPQKDGRPIPLFSETDRLLSLSVCFSVLLVLIRMIHTGRNTFLFLLWNIFLAWLPYLITGRLARMQPFRPRFLFAALMLAWLLFIPNSFYIITDLFHLNDWYNDRQMPSWFDLAMILSFVWNGLLLGVLSVRQMERIVKPRLPAHHELFFLYPVMWLNALGIYTGRYLRFNSWNLVTDPFQLFGDMARLVIHPLRNQYVWAMIFCFSILMTLMYLMLKRISKTLN